MAEVPALDYHRPIFTERLRPSRQMLALLAMIPVLVFCVQLIFGVLIGRTHVVGATIQVLFFAVYGGVVVLSQTQSVTVYFDEIVVQKFGRSRRIRRSELLGAEVVKLPSTFLQAAENSGVELRVQFGPPVRIRSNKPRRLLAALQGDVVTVLPVAQSVSATLKPYSETVCSAPSHHRGALLMAALLLALLTVFWLNTTMDNRVSVATSTAVTLGALAWVTFVCISLTQSYKIKVDLSGVTVKGRVWTRHIPAQAIEGAELVNGNFASRPRPFRGFGGRNPQEELIAEHFQLGHPLAVMIHETGNIPLVIDTPNADELLASIRSLIGVDDPAASGSSSTPVSVSFTGS